MKRHSPFLITDCADELMFGVMRVCPAELANPVPTGGADGTRVEESS